MIYQTAYHQMLNYSLMILLYFQLYKHICYWSRKYCPAIRTPTHLLQQGFKLLQEVLYCKITWQNFLSGFFYKQNRESSLWKWCTDQLMMTVHINRNHNKGQTAENLNASKVSKYRDFTEYLDWIQKTTEWISVFNLNTGKYGAE